MLKSLKEKGITIMVSTPYMDEALRCERIAFIQNGHIMAIDTPVNITKSFSHPLFEVRSSNLHHLLLDLRNFKDTYSCYAFGQTAHLAVTSGSMNEQGIRDFLTKLGHTEIKINTISAGIEDCFMDLMQKTEA
jgi:ABC-type multidrug transport system ATPase subunit